jgi:hypothetical protein
MVVVLAPKKRSSKTITLARPTAVFTLAALVLGVLLSVINIGSGTFMLVDKYLAGAEKAPKIDIDYYTVESYGAFYEDIVTKASERIRKDDLFQWPIQTTPAYAWFESGAEGGKPGRQFSIACLAANGSPPAQDATVFFKAAFALIRNIGGTRIEGARLEFKTKVRDAAANVLLPNALDGSTDWTDVQTIEIRDLEPGGGVLVPVGYGCIGPGPAEDPDSSLALGPNHAPTRLTYDFQGLWRSQETVTLRPPRLSPTIVSSGVAERG